MIRLCALTSIVAASHTLDMSRHGDESEISASPGTSGSELGLPDINVKLASLVSSDNDILSDLIAVSKGHSPGDGTQMENTLSSVVTDFVIRHEIDASDLSCSRKYDSLCPVRPRTRRLSYPSVCSIGRLERGRRWQTLSRPDGWMYTASGMCSAPPEYAGPCPTLYDLQNHNRIERLESKRRKFEESELSSLEPSTAFVDDVGRIKRRIDDLEMRREEQEAEMFQGIRRKLLSKNSGASFSFDTSPVSIRVGSAGPFPRVVDLVAGMERRRDEREASIRHKYLEKDATALAEVGQSRGSARKFRVNLYPPQESTSEVIHSIDVLEKLEAELR
ncbi:hypothetical protein FOZ60_008285 [Perkinsus olseni]|uniref:Uncharacterized protein n=1 Tax=Perkinsus olseni TaxID=32597 RepID=A0A7J6PE60_PEROL|nr:hypothetical protein FOZ60_008285 [Perkinsus olseni]